MQAASQQRQQQQSQRRVPTSELGETTKWALAQVAGTFSTAEAAAIKLREAESRCRVVGGTSVMPLRLGYELAITVVPIVRSSLYPINGWARAIVAGKEPTDKDREEPQPRWGIGKAILNTLAAAAGVEWLTVQVTEPAAYLWRAKVTGRYRSVEGTHRMMLAERDCDFRDGSPQLSGKTEKEIPVLRATGRRKAETGAKLRAIREALGIEHGVWEHEVDVPFVFAHVVWTGRAANPKIEEIFAYGIVQERLLATGMMFGPVPGQPQAPQLQAPSFQPAALSEAKPFEPLDDTDEPTTAAPPSLPPAPPKPPPAPGDPRKLYLPGRKGEVPTIWEAKTQELVKAEKRQREGFLQGTWDEKYFDANLVQLLTMREELRYRQMPVEACPRLDEPGGAGEPAGAQGCGETWGPGEQPADAAPRGAA